MRLANMSAVAMYTTHKHTHTPQPRRGESSQGVGSDAKVPRAPHPHSPFQQSPRSTWPACMRVSAYVRECMQMLALCEFACVCVCVRVDVNICIARACMYKIYTFAYINVSHPPPHTHPPTHTSFSFHSFKRWHALLTTTPRAPMLVISNRGRSFSPSPATIICSGTNPKREATCSAALPCV